MTDFVYGLRHTYRVLQTIQMKLILLCVWAEPAVLGSAKTALKFQYEIQCLGQGISLKSERNNPWSNILLHTQSINCVCHSIRSMFRVLGIYNFDFYFNA